MFQPHPSNPLLYQLKCPYKKYIYGTYEEILGKIKKFGLHSEDFYQRKLGNAYAKFCHTNNSEIYIEVIETSFIRDCINFNCKAGYKKSIISALCRRFNLHQNIPPQVLWEALGVDDFKRDIMLAAYKK
jgi:hypothetical protein